MARQTKMDALADTLGTDFAELLREALPRIAQAMKREGASSSYSATVQFTTNKSGELVSEMTGRERVPSPSITRKIALHGDQLRLFEGPARDGDDDADVE